MTHNNEYADLIRCIPQIRRYIARRIDNHHDTDDLVQETVAKVLKSTNLSQVKTPIAYFISVAGSVIADYWRGSEKRSFGKSNVDEEDIEGVHESPEKNLINLQRVEEIIALIENMPKTRREVLIRKRLHGMSRTEIALELGISEEAVKKHITRALLTLRNSAAR